MEPHKASARCSEPRPGLIEARAAGDKLSIHGVAAVSEMHSFVGGRR